MHSCGCCRLVSCIRHHQVSDFGTIAIAEAAGQVAADPRGRLGTDGSLIERITKANLSVGSVIWRAPEITLGKPFSKASDVYSFGIVLWYAARGGR
jgi:serine/threonine protein kinase